MVMVLMVFEGAVRKWLLPSMQASLFFFKDGLLLLALGAWYAGRRYHGIHERLQRPYSSLIMLTVLFCILQIANPNSPSLLLGLLGAKNYLFYTCLIFMVPLAFESADNFEKCMKIYMLIMLPVALLGVVQFQFPPDHWINASVAQDVDADTAATLFGLDNRARTSSTFSYVSGFSTFILAMFSLSLAFILSAQAKSREKWVPLCLLVGCSLAMFTTGSRGAVYGCMAIATMAACLCLSAGVLNGVACLRITFGTALVGAITVLYGTDAIDAFEYRASTSDDPVVRLFSPFSELMGAFDVTPFFGLGIGVNSNASRIIMEANDLWWLQGNVFEAETARVMQECGLVGFFLIYGLRLGLFLFAIRMVFALRTELFKVLSSTIAGFFFVHLGLSVINNATAGLYHWFAAGLLFAMYRLDYESCAYADADEVPVAA
jgi:hypothetical protein